MISAHPRPSPSLQGNRIGSLCAPAREVTCFHCCPPIRPLTHDTVFIRESWLPVLRENTRRFEHNLDQPYPIDGRSCWALGFLDHRERYVGCLLHPARHASKDLRFLTGFGGKCRRESCLEARAFLGLTPEVTERCLACAPMDDSFLYSSRLHNPIFRLLAWEEDVVRAISEREETSLTRERLLRRYAPLFEELEPRMDGYWITCLVQQQQWWFLNPQGMDLYRRFRDAVGVMLRQRWGKRGPWDHSHLPMVHVHDIPLQLSRWLKFGVGIWRANRREINEIKPLIESELRKFLRSAEKA